MDWRIDRLMDSWIEGLMHRWSHGLTKWRIDVWWIHGLMDWWFDGLMSGGFMDTRRQKNEGFGYEKHFVFRFSDTTKETKEMFRGKACLKKIIFWYVFSNVMTGKKFQFKKGFFYTHSVFYTDRRDHGQRKANWKTSEALKAQRPVHKKKHPFFLMCFPM